MYIFVYITYLYLPSIQAIQSGVKQIGFREQKKKRFFFLYKNIEKEK